jgi:Outer membrane protein beta-barrel domain
MKIRTEDCFAQRIRPTLKGGTVRTPSGSARGYVIRLMVGLILATPAAYAQRREEPVIRPWWVGLELGDGQIKLSSDQFRGTRNSAFALGGVGGHSLGNRARIGLELNGWLLQSFNNNNPAVGESVSNVLGIVDAFPIRKTPVFLRAGGGLALYQNNRPGGFSSSGWSWTAGVGYEIPLTENFGLAPMVDYAAGSLGDVRNIITVDTGRRYSVVEFKAAAIWHFGRPK